ncbi:Methyltransferase type 11 [Solidesulfovibrio fructosivorans JJ]]|uniref:Methyltransferase type 11 n=1 Tax=Solidesulfovibrio fructosivorans JJ] TaxID=596151 RepID=E1JXD7_SOLFR|nr:class I SAM-dependent methyltransferase [Solidesulfovibrio fructosivorans]EFL50914.1 Methyltransferase type 11 [Solidesulfovibrio fructosivorans JJ]]
MEGAVSTAFDRREVFTKLRAHDRMCHVAAYAWLEGFLAGRGQNGDGLRLLDLGCNDARDMVRVLSAGDVTAYTGVDTDTDCLAAAWKNLADSPAAADLVAADGREILAGLREAVDVIWMGLLLHHFPREEKARLFAMAKNALRPGGELLTHDPMPGDGESAEAFLARYNRVIEAGWTELTPEERRVLVAHWSRHGRHDSIDVVERLAREAGFSKVVRRRLDPDGFYALLRFAV